jgi:hypothetical protein
MLPTDKDSLFQTTGCVTGGQLRLGRWYNEAFANQAPFTFSFHPVTVLYSLSPSVTPHRKIAGVTSGSWLCHRQEDRRKNGRGIIVASVVFERLFWKFCGDSD